ncbi:MAG TPA: CU044_2847 family protein [Streptosporangiaceae bacterium]|nr:CU044_2847 family protein [Streptosporangiaceae bacterium]
MNTTITELRFGEETVMVATVLPPGSQPTSVADKLRERSIDALHEVESTIEAVAKGTVETAGRLTKSALAPASIEVELGIAFTAKGGVIIAGGEVEASIVIHLTYDLSAGKNHSPNSLDGKKAKSVSGSGRIA